MFVKNNTINLDLLTYVVTQAPNWVPDVEPEAEVEPASEPEPEPENWPEPGPNWTIAYSLWGWAWPFHVYFFVSMYCLIVILTSAVLSTFYGNFRMCVRSKMTISILTMILIFGVSRATFLCLDPYLASGNIPPLLYHLLWSIGPPIQTSAFSIVLLVLLDSTKLTLGPPRFQRLSTIAAITLGHFAIVLTVHMLVLYYPDASNLLILCQIVFILYGTALAAGYLYVGIAIRKNTTIAHVKDPQGRQIVHLTKISFMSSFFAGFISCTYIYASVSEFGIGSQRSFVDAWSWWSLQSIMRLEEVIVCFLVLVTVSKNSTYETFSDNIVRCCKRADDSESFSGVRDSRKRSTSSDGVILRVYSFLPFVKRQSISTTHM